MDPSSKSPPPLWPLLLFAGILAIVIPVMWVLKTDPFGLTVGFLPIFIPLAFALIWPITLALFSSIEGPWLARHTAATVLFIKVSGGAGGGVTLQTGGGPKSSGGELDLIAGNGAGSGGPGNIRLIAANNGGSFGYGIIMLGDPYADRPGILRFYPSSGNTPVQLMLPTGGAAYNIALPPAGPSTGNFLVVANAAGSNYGFTTANTTWTNSIPSLTLSSITGSTQCLHVNTSGVVSGTGCILR